VLFGGASLVVGNTRQGDVQLEQGGLLLRSGFPRRARARAAGGAAAAVVVGSWCAAVCSAPVRINVAEFGRVMGCYVRLRSRVWDRMLRMRWRCPVGGIGVHQLDCQRSGHGWSRREVDSGESPRPVVGRGGARPLQDPRSIADPRCSTSGGSPATRMGVAEWRRVTPEQDFREGPLVTKISTQCPRPSALSVQSEVVAEGRRPGRVENPTIHLICGFQLVV
jgi:hypothetical protein